MDVLRLDAIEKSAGDGMLQRDPPQVVAMMCRTLSVGGVSSIAMPVCIGGLSNSPQRLPGLRLLASMRRWNSSGTAMPLGAGNTSPPSWIVPTAGRMCVPSPSSNSKTASTPAATRRQAQLLPIERCDWSGRSRKVSFYVGLFLWRKAAANLAHHA
jgi:hypothetical protein